MPGARIHHARIHRASQPSIAAPGAPPASDQPSAAGKIKNTKPNQSRRTLPASASCPASCPRHRLPPKDPLSQIRQTGLPNEPNSHTQRQRNRPRHPIHRPRTLPRPNLSRFPFQKKPNKSPKTGHYRTKPHPAGSFASNGWSKATATSAASNGPPSTVI